MTELLQAIFLGVVQGLTEFLPVSSSAHLVLSPWLLGFEASFLHSLTFDVALHVGTLAAVLLYFWRDWRDVARATLAVAGGRPRPDRHRRLLGYLVMGSVPAAIAGLLFEQAAEGVFRHPLLIAGTLAGFGLLLGAADRWPRGRRGLIEARWQDAMIIGVAQAMAIVPGISRSGITITAGRVLGLTREAAAHFSFLLMTPAVAGAGLLKGVRLVREGLPAAEVVPFAAGTLVAAVIGLAAIAWLLRYLRAHSVWPFVWYRLALAVVVAAAFVQHSL